MWWLRSSSWPTIQRRWLLTAAAAVCLVGLLYGLLGASPERWIDVVGRKSSSKRWRLSTALADASILFLCVALAMGPLRVLRGGRPARHLPWRRSVGVGGALLGLAHVLFGIGVHDSLRRPWIAFLTARPTLRDPLPLLSGLRGAANYFGLLTVALLVPLVATSNRLMMRRLKAARWKLLQRLAYVVFASVAVHATLYHIVERRLLVHRVGVLAALSVTGFLQLAAMAALHRRSAASPLGLAQRRVRPTP